MQSLELSERDRAHLSETQALSLDAQGRETLVGLTRDESEWYLRDQSTWFEQRTSGTRAKADKARYIELNEKHETARIHGIGLTNMPPAGSA